MSTMYNSLIILIKSKNYDEEDIAKKADMYLLKNRITEDEYNQIYAMIQGNKEEAFRAQVTSDLDCLKLLMEE